MEDALSAMFTGIDYGAVAVFEIEFLGDMGDHLEEVSGEAGVFGGEIIEGDEWFFGYEEDVDGGLGIDIMEGEAELVFVDDIGGDFAVDDFLEDSHRGISGG